MFGIAMHFRFVFKEQLHVALCISMLLLRTELQPVKQAFEQHKLVTKFVRIDVLLSAVDLRNMCTIYMLRTLLLSTSSRRSSVVEEDDEER